MTATPPPPLVLRQIYATAENYATSGATGLRRFYDIASR